MLKKRGITKNVTKNAQPNTVEKCDTSLAVLVAKELINKMGTRKIILVVDRFLKIFLNPETAKKKYITKVKKN